MDSEAETTSKKTEIVSEPNVDRRTAEVKQTLEALGCDPIEAMAKIAMDESQPIALRASMYRELAQYVAPKRKAVEVTGEDDGPVQYGVLLVSGMADRAGG